MRFGFEIEMISKKDRRDLAIEASQILGPKKIDIDHYSYHSHNVNQWGFEGDGSLRGNSEYPYGVEMISPPMKINELGFLKQLLSAFNGQVTTNKTCGLHVHVEMSDIKQVNNVLRIWKRFEKDIIKAFPLSRRQGNHYCKRMNRLNKIKLLQSSRDRYYMVNSQSYSFRGTIEFRGHSGSVNYHKIKRWVLFCMAIAKIAQNYVDRSVQLEEILNKRSLNVFKFLEITPKTKRYFQGRIKHFQKLEKGGLQQCAA